jgi:hypothetical protein
MHYTLTARKGEEFERVDLEATDDFDATFEAVKVILDRANEPDGYVWRLGYIMLKGQDGTVLHTMEEKDET